MADDRMSPLDSSFLHMEDDVSHMHIGSIGIFEGPSPGHDRVVAMVEGKLPLVPRYRQVVRTVPLDLGRPVWSDDPHFNIEYHIRHTALPAPGGEGELRRLVGRVMSQRLDRGKPLWEIWVVEGFEQDRWAMVSKTHHCMVDGVSGTDLLSVIMDHSPDAAPTPPVPWEPEPSTSRQQLAATAVLDMVRSPYEQLRAVRSATRVPRQALGQLGDVAAGIRSMAGLVRPTPTSTLNGPIGPHRRYEWASTSVDDIKAVRKVGAMFASLPVGLEDPAERLAAISTQMDGLKESRQAVAGEALTSLSGFAPPVLLALGTRAAARAPQRNINTVTTNVPGPQVPLYAAGRRMLKAYPYVPLAGSVRVGVSIFSYDGQVNFGITGDYDSAPDIAVLGRGIEQGMDELLTLAEAGHP